MLEIDTNSLTLVGRLILASLGVSIAWLATSSVSILRSLGSPQPEQFRPTSELFSGTEGVFITGLVVSNEHHVAECSGARAVQSRLSIYTKSIDNPETWWSDTKYMVLRQQPYQIDDGSGVLAAPPRMWVKETQMISRQCMFNELSEEVRDLLVSTFGPDAEQDLSSKRLRLDEVFLPVGARVYASCTVKANHTVEFSAISQTSMGPPDQFAFLRQHHAIRSTLLTLIAIGLIASAIAF